MTWANIRGVFYMIVVAGLFSAWQQNRLAFAFMLAATLFVEKLFRVIVITLQAR